MKNYTVISDPGIDDIVALVLLYKLDPGAKNVLVSTFGNAAEEITSINAKEFIAFVAKSWKYLSGSSTPLNGTVEHSWPDYFHGPDGVWGVHPSISIRKVQKATTTTKNILSLAPLTEPLKLIRSTEVKEITIMGGTFNLEGNETKYAETNIAFDPDSARCLFEKVQDLEVKVVPLDVTRKVYWSRKQVKNIPESNDINKWLKKLITTWFDKYDHKREMDFNLHDPLAVYLNYQSNFAVWIKSGIEVVVKGKKRGQTIFSDFNPKCNIATNIKDADHVANSIYDIVFNLA